MGSDLRIDQQTAESIVGEPEAHHRADWHYKDKSGRERCDLLSYECPFVHFKVEAGRVGEG